MAILKLNNTTVITETSGVASIASTVKFPAGHVIQTTQNTYNSLSSANSTTSTPAKCVDGSGNNHWKHTISGMTAGNDVLVQMNFILYTYKAIYYNGGAAHIYRDNNLIYTGHASSTFIQTYNNTASYRPSEITHQVYTSLIFLDEGATATSHSYYLGISGNNGIVRVESVSNLPPYVCILQEVSK